jgi:hypothetical protein
VALHRLICRARALGVDPRPTRRVQDPSPSGYRSRRRSGEGPLSVRYALATGSDLPGGTAASRIRDATSQWAEPAIRRTTPALLGLSSAITLFTHRRMRRATGAFRRAAWYHKAHPTFSDASALVRKELWAHATFCGSPSATDTTKVPRAFVERLTDAVCYAA